MCILKTFYHIKNEIKYTKFKQNRAIIIKINMYIYKKIFKFKININF